MFLNFVGLELKIYDVIGKGVEYLVYLVDFIWIVGIIIWEM